MPGHTSMVGEINSSFGDRFYENVAMMVHFCQQRDQSYSRNSKEQWRVGELDSYFPQRNPHLHLNVQGLPREPLLKVPVELSLAALQNVKVSKGGWSGKVHVCWSEWGISVGLSLCTSKTRK
jgi:hypothetical protein